MSIFTLPAASDEVNVNGLLTTLEQRRVSNLMELLPSHPRCHNSIIQWTASPPRKTAPVLNRPARYEDYLAHLSVGPTDYVGTLGLFPQFAERGSLHARFLALDVDHIQPTSDAAQVLFGALRDLRVRYYVTTGTTGRGMHIFLFLTDANVGSDGFRAAKALADVAEGAGVVVDTVRPDQPKGAGGAIFIPYAAALKDGYGKNPLLDPERDLQPVRLEHVASVGRNDQDVLKQLARRVLTPRGALQSITPRRVLPSEASAVEVFRHELERLLPYWVQGVRQRLTLGLTALALFRLDLPEDVIVRELQLFWARAHDSEVSERLRACHSTFTAFRDKKPIAFVRFYQEAGLQPPAHIVSGGLANALGRLAHWESHDFGRGLKNATNSKVLKTLYWAALKWGTLREDGVAVRISRRHLAELAHVALKTADASLTRLRDQDALVLLNGERTKGGAGSIVLLVSAVPEGDASKLQCRTVDEVLTLEAHPAFRVRCLNTSAIPVIRALYKAARPLTTQELANETNNEPANLRKPLTKLVEHAVVLHDKTSRPSRYSLPADWRERLTQSAEVTGANRRAALQKQRHLQERKNYAEYLSYRYDAPVDQPLARAA